MDGKLALKFVRRIEQGGKIGLLLTAQSAVGVAEFAGHSHHAAGLEGIVGLFDLFRLHLGQDTHKPLVEPKTLGLHAADAVRDPVQGFLRIAGIEVPAGTRLLISDEAGVGPKFPFSKEKLTALLGFYVVNDWHQACELCQALLHNCGIGHSLAIHSRNEEVIREFGLKKPVSRILVNTPSTHGGVGITTGLFPSFTLGCGAVGGSATSDNVTPMNLLNIRRVAYDLGNTPCQSHHECCHSETPSHAASCGAGAGIDINAITSLIVAELKKVM